jgi:hypothetical protein
VIGPVAVVWKPPTRGPSPGVPLGDVAAEIGKKPADCA